MQVPKILILRTFTHERIWEGHEGGCKYYGEDIERIKMWEPDYMNFTLEDFDGALGIYMKEYFDGWYDKEGNYRPPTDKHSDEEKVMHRLRLRNHPVYKTNRFAFHEFIWNVKGQIVQEILYVFFSHSSNLWDMPDKDLIFKIDRELLAEKENELRRKGIPIPGTDYTPLSFSLEANIVESVLRKNNVIS